MRTRTVVVLLTCGLFVALSACDDEKKEVLDTNAELDQLEQADEAAETDVVDADDDGIEADTEQVEGDQPLDQPELEQTEVEEVPPDQTELEDLGPIESCSQLSAAACLDNSGCNADERCQSFSETLELRCCVEGVRGSAEAGEACTTENDCAFGRCIERDDGARFCSGPCGGDLDCPVFMFCSDFFGWCAPKDADWQPTSCFEVSLDQCFYNDNCEAGERCENVASEPNEVLCCRPGVPGTKAVGENCSSGNDCSFGRCFDGLCSAYCDFDEDPCPQPLMECNFISGYCQRS